MNFKKVLKRTGTFLFAFGLTGATAFAAVHTYSFTLTTEESAYTGICRKTNANATAYVTRQTPASPVTTIRVTVCNGDGINKTSSQNIEGVGTAYLSYTNHVDYGDSFRLRVANPSTPNQGHTITAGGAWEP